ncbi:MAG: radical SAM family heme chaperone HemW [Parvibaculum sp.]|nr:radical SAM family heme chaperone HemW [Parvibaculum sp.]
MPASGAEAQSISLPSPTEGGFGIYVHWPFCLSKCPYCDFNSHVVANVDQSRWAAALVRELTFMRDLTGPRRVSSIFFGGGTPSLMEVSTVEAVIGAIQRLWYVDNDVEISLEANPTSVEATRFLGYRAAGVNRLSLGVQSLDDAQLKFLGRLHSADEALKAIGLARGIFPRLSFDLIYARPGQTREAWARELKLALAHTVDHLSLYQLTIEEGTAFAKLYEKGAFKLPDEDDAAALYNLTGEICAQSNMRAYEVSNYAAPDAECRHNLVYWRYGDYVGVGPGAHGRITTSEGRIATAGFKAPGAWLASVEARDDGLETRENVSASEQGDEMMLMGLRLTEGVSLSRFERLAGQPLEATRLSGLVAQGLLTREGDVIATTPDGRLVLNGVLGRLLA